MCSSFGLDCIISLIMTGYSRTFFIYQVSIVMLIGHYQCLNENRWFGLWRSIILKCFFHIRGNFIFQKWSMRCCDFIFWIHHSVTAVLPSLCANVFTMTWAKACDCNLLCNIYDLITQTIHFPSIKGWGTMCRFIGSDVEWRITVLWFTVYSLELALNNSSTWAGEQPNCNFTHKWLQVLV